MRKTIDGLLAVGFVCAGAWVGCAHAADEAAPAVGGTLAPAAAPAGGQAATGATGGEAAAAGACCKADDTTPPLNLIKATPQGGLHNPYDDQIDRIAEEGHKKFLSLAAMAAAAAACVPAH